MAGQPEAVEQLVVELAGDAELLPPPVDDHDDPHDQRKAAEHCNRGNEHNHRRFPGANPVALEDTTAPPSMRLTAAHSLMDRLGLRPMPDWGRFLPAVNWKS